ncbi:MAG: ATP-dependent helicase, partial [Cetobacterium sp.]
MNIEEKISLDAISKMKMEIEKENGKEMLFRGIPNDVGVIVDIKILTKAKKYTLPTILRKMKKEEVIIFNHSSKHLHPTDGEVEVAANYSTKLDGAAYIVDNSLTELYELVELVQKSNIKIDIKPYFEKKGLLASVFSEFEYRKEQLEMAKVIEE